MNKVGVKGATIALLYPEDLVPSPLLAHPPCAGSRYYARRNVPQNGQNLAAGGTGCSHAVHGIERVKSTGPHIASGRNVETQFSTA